MFASNESSTVGAVRALKDRKGVKLVGFDSSPQLIEALKSGVIDSLVAQDPFQMGYKSMKAAIAKTKRRHAGEDSEHCAHSGHARKHGFAGNTGEDSPDLDKYLK